mmetsp:Transcript_28623/g.56243  ORF Transcript_28623/g.56243 Transcript_28623/m.56243 type:complete len:177 (+) Transcript_28623:13-543(+)
MDLEDEEGVGLVSQQVERPPQTPGWSFGMFSCCDNCETCLITCCLPPYRFSLTTSRSQLLPFNTAILLYGIPWLILIGTSLILGAFERKDIHAVFTGQATSSDSWSYWVVSMLGTVCTLFLMAIAIVYRGKLRERYGIEGNCFSDFVAHFCCSCCALVQEARHTDHAEGIRHMRNE